MLRVVDLFSGCGGMSLGFHQAGYEIAAAFDYWEPAVKVYRKNFTHPIFQSDLSKLTNYDTLTQYDPEMIIGGPPCQDFSSAGKRDETGNRADLTLTFADIATSIKPKWFVMENVDRIVKTNILKRIKILFRNAGYGLSEEILKASLCGVPQD
jgi:DNA (cytosine-5)-methyltransferase 1